MQRSSSSPDYPSSFRYFICSHAGGKACWNAFTLDPKVLGDSHQECYCQRNLIQLPNEGLHPYNIQALRRYERNYEIALFSDLSPKPY